MFDEMISTTSAAGLKIAILQSTYHYAITHKLALGAKEIFIENGGVVNDCDIIKVAGAWELPIVSKIISQTENYNGIVALGCIITGETTHDKVIAHAIANGLMQVSLDWGHPISMGILTCQTLEQAVARAGGDSGNKGIEAMLAVIKTETTLREQHAK